MFLQHTELLFHSHMQILQGNHYKNLLQVRQSMIHQDIPNSYLNEDLRMILQGIELLFHLHIQILQGRQ
jgi:hypothetical protein